MSGLSSIFKREDHYNAIFNPKLNTIPNSLRNFINSNISFEEPFFREYQDEDQDEYNCKKNYKQSLINFKTFLDNENLNKIHTNTIDDIFNIKPDSSNFQETTSILEDIPNITNDISEENNYNLFFLHMGDLYEFQTTEKILVKKSKTSINIMNVRDHLFNEIMKKNDQFIYENDFTIFNIVEPEREKDQNSKTEGIFVVTLVTILFIINFFLHNPQGIYVSYYIIII